jgi:hypothetical protein
VVPCLDRLHTYLFPVSTIPSLQCVLICSIPMQSRRWLHVRDGSSRQRAGSAVARLLLCPRPPPLTGASHHLLRSPHHLTVAPSPPPAAASAPPLLCQQCPSSPPLVHKQRWGARDPAADSTAHTRCGRGFHRASEIRLWTPPRVRDPVVDSIRHGARRGARRGWARVLARRLRRRRPTGTPRWPHRIRWETLENRRARED